MSLHYPRDLNYICDACTHPTNHGMHVVLACDVNLAAQGEVGFVCDTCLMNRPEIVRIDDDEPEVSFWTRVINKITEALRPKPSFTPPLDWEDEGNKACDLDGLDDPRAIQPDDYYMIKDGTVRIRVGYLIVTITKDDGTLSVSCHASDEPFDAPLEQFTVMHDPDDGCRES